MDRGIIREALQLPLVQLSFAPNRRADLGGYRACRCGEFRTRRSKPVRRLGLRYTL
jgi:hypothetical protein